MRPRWGWQVCGWLLVSLSLVSVGIFTGCQKAGGGGGSAEAPPPSTTPPSTTPPSTTPPSTTPPTSPPAVSPVVGITLTAGQTSLPADGASSTTITAALITPSGGPVDDGTAVTFTTDIGRFNVSGAKTITTTATGSSGSVVVPFISEAGVAGIATILATAQDIIQKLTIEFVAVAPQSPTTQVAGILLQADSTSLVANGTSSTFITAALITSTGDVAGDGITVNFITDLGRFTVDGAKTAAASTSGGTGKVRVQFISEKDIFGTATIVANVGGVAQSIQIALTEADDPSTIILDADSTVISVLGTTGITATVLDGEGNPVTDGTAVFFRSDRAGTAVTPSDTTIGGLATAIFSAGKQSGVATVEATSGTVSATISITIASGPAGSLEFVLAEPTVIGVKGSAIPQKSTITFRVRDVNGNPVTDGTLVTFTLISGVSGGETLEPVQVGTITVLEEDELKSLASTVLTSGTVSGPVRVLASVTVGSTTLTSSSTNVSITGGPPSGAHIGVAPSFRNIAGLVTQGIICPVTAIVGDRFGNPVPQNTTVSFFTNGGVVAPQGLTDELGNAPSEIKTGPPTPRVGSTPDPGPSDPRTGFVTVIAITQGEETFIDSDGDGVFDGPGEFDPTDPEIDTPEAFIDQVNLCNGLPFPAPCPADPLNPPVLSGDGVFDPNNRFELFIDANGNGGWDIPNGVWDANKPIFATTRVLFTGPTQLAIGELQADGTCNTGVPLGFNVPPGGSSQAFCFIASDPAGRPLVRGTRITVTTSAGAISGTTSVILPDTQRGGPGITLFSFAVVSEDPDDEDPEADALVTVSVVSPSDTTSDTTCPGRNGDLAVSFPGTVD